MADITIWHNPRCSKSRISLALLTEQGVEPTEVRYLETPPSRAEIERVLELLAIPPIALMRRGEAAFKELQLSTDSTDEQLLEAMASHPILIERPVVFRDNKAVIGRPPENVLELLDQ
jgi:arsenate reductase